MDTSQSTAARLMERLRLLEVSLDQTIDDHYQAFELVVSCVQDMRDEVMTSGFENETDQIQFFRNIKPRVIGLLTYHRFILEFKSKEKISDVSQARKFANEMVQVLRKTDGENESVIHYLNSQSKHLDTIFFVQVRNLGTYNMMNHQALLDPDFSSLCDEVISNQIARELIESYLKKQTETETVESQKLTWTDSKAALVELIYALHFSQSVNKGDVSLKELCEVLEQTFSIKLGDLYGTFKDIQMRKGERAKYLTSLLDRFGERIDENEGY